MALSVFWAPVPASAEEDTVRGTIVRSVLTLCSLRPEGGGCTGSLILETGHEGAVVRREFRVVPETIIRQGGKPGLLHRVERKNAVVAYVATKGENVARTVDID
jgi:hypothetical protein